ncbi:histidine phosphatase family protein [Psychrosphaera haliotis]|uniref:Histidine phosphatase family protein n=1 Tax=Psychrosphaera haliotis TaxID=555083 RepID=A0A6N8F9V8_9GAMM|nr:histidine phosphatase family protein [Psychrosphaera haliotis]
MSTIYLIRHGQASAKSENYDCLSALGEEQSQLLAPHLKSCVGNLKIIVRGDMQRHLQTAAHFENLLETGSAEIRINPGWNEYDHQDILAAYNPQLRTPAGIKAYLEANKLTKKEFKSVFLDAMKQWLDGNSSTTYAESWIQFKARVLSSFEDIRLNGNGDIVVFTSGGPISLITSHLLGLPHEKFMNINWSLVNAGVTKILVNSKTGHCTLSSLNEHSIFDVESTRNRITYT